MAKLLQLGLQPPEVRSSNPAPATPGNRGLTLEWLYGHLDTGSVLVNAGTVRQLAAVAASLRLITGSLSSLPLSVVEIATQKKAPEHPAYKLIARQPNDEQTIAQVLTVFVEAALLHGTAFLQVTRNPVTKVVDGLWPFTRP